MSATNPLNKKAISDELILAVAPMDISMFGLGDVINMILQRAQVIYDVERGGQLIRAWVDGDEGPLREVAEARHEVLIRRTLASILDEYNRYAPVLRDIAPKRLADIGCGYGFFDVFAARDLDAHVVLIDIEESENRHFGFKKEGAAYSNLSVAKDFALANGVAKDQVTTINPRSEDLTTLDPVDVAMSFMSCGFHYPVETYMDYFRDGVTEMGSVILDLRRARADAQSETLSVLGVVETLEETEALRCVHVRKGAG